MATKAATYSTILPDDTPMYDAYQQPDNHQDGRQHRQSQQPREQQMRDASSQRPADARNMPAHVSIDVRDDTTKNATPATAQGAAEKERLINKHISTNKTLTYGLLFVVALLLMVIGYQVFQQRKLTSELPVVQQNPATSSDDPPQNRQPQRVNQDLKSSELPYPDPGSGFAKPPQIIQRELANQAARDAHRNDRILKQSQHKTLSQASGQPKTQSAMSRRAGCTEEDDQRRLETITEENDPGDDQINISERTRAIIAEQLRKDAMNDVRDDPLGTGSIDVVDADTAARRDLRKAEMRASPLQDERDEALVEQENPQEEEDEDDAEVVAAPIVVLCSQVLATGTRAGQECQRECKPGNTKCNSHLARAKK